MARCRQLLTFIFLSSVACIDADFRFISFEGEFHAPNRSFIFAPPVHRQNRQLFAKIRAAHALTVSGCKCRKCRQGNALKRFNGDNPSRESGQYHVLSFIVSYLSSIMLMDYAIIFCHSFWVVQRLSSSDYSKFL